MTFKKIRIYLDRLRSGRSRRLFAFPQTQNRHSPRADRSAFRQSPPVSAKPRESPKTIIPRKKKRPPRPPKPWKSRAHQERGQRSGRSPRRSACRLPGSQDLPRKRGPGRGAQGAGQGLRPHAQAKLPADSPLLQEKNDLRILIAQRIQEVYACRMNPGRPAATPWPWSRTSGSWTRSKTFQTVERASFIESYKRSGLYREMIAAEFRKLASPKRCPGFRLSKRLLRPGLVEGARAGDVQFIASTGYRYGLNRDRWVDERMDPEKAARAAAKFPQ